MRLRGNLKHSRNSRRIRINVPPSCHSDRSASGVEESTTWQKVPTQGIICNLSGFLDSLPFARNDISGGGTIHRHRLYSSRCQPLAGAGVAMNHRRYSGCTMYRVIPFNPTGYTSNVAGGRLPMELWCDCPRQSIDFDSLREAPPLRTLTAWYKRTTLVAPITVNCPLSTVN